MVRLCVVYPLIHDQRNKEPQLGDLHSDGLDVHPINAVFDEVKLAAVVQFVFVKRSFDVRDQLIACLRIWKLAGSCDLSCFPFFVAGIKPRQDED